MNIPNELYKFESINENSLRNLKNSQLYFRRPSSFNDPFDCSLHLGMFKVDNDECIDVFNHFARKNGKEIISKNLSTIKIYDEITQSIKTRLSEYVQEVKDRLLNEIGCTCFSESNKNILMWSHYASGHKGMCLEFDTTNYPFNKARKVNYSETFAEMIPSKLMFEDTKSDDSEWMIPLITKHIDWFYEEEWRIFDDNPDTLHTYSPASLKAIYFGGSINQADLEIVCLIVKGQNPNVKFYKSTKNESKYAIDFEEFT